MSKSDLKPLNILESLLFPLLIRKAHGAARERLNRRHDLTKKRAEQRKERKAMIKGMVKECKHYEKLLVDCFIRIGEAWMVGAAGIETGGKAPRKAKVQKVKFSRIFYNEEQVFFEIQVNKRWLYTTRNMLPHRVMVANLVSEPSLFELGHATKRLVKASYDDPRFGAWIIVNRLMGFDGIPLTVTYKEILDYFPTDKIEDVPLIVGSGENRKLAVFDLAHNPHILIGGSTRSGKSNFVNMLICNFIRFSPADDLKLILIDLKRMEFGYYKDAPHLMRPIVFTEEGAVEVLAYLVDEIHRRTEMLADHAKELSEWNRKFPDQRLPRIICIIDEFAELMLSDSKEIVRSVETLVTRICNLGRAPGIHAVVATQRPASDVVHNRVKVNMSLIVAGRVQNADQSRVIIGNSEAARLPDHPGRMIYLRGSNLVQIQTPFVTEDDIQESMGIAKGRHARIIDLDGYEPVIIPDGLVVYLFDCLGGKLTAENLKRLRPLGVPMRALREFIEEMIKKGGWTVGRREFKLEKREGNYWQMVEQPRVERIIPDEDDFGENQFVMRRPALTFTPLGMLNAGSIQSAIEHIKGSGPIEPERKPDPIPDETPSPDEPTPQPMPPGKHPLTMTDDEVIGLFIERCCKTGHGRFKATIADLHGAYMVFCEQLDKEIPPLSIRVLSRKLAARGLKPYTDGKSRGFKGIKLGHSENPVVFADSDQMKGKQVQRW